jgi:hypothetical protein
MCPLLAGDSSRIKVPRSQGCLQALQRSFDVERFFREFLTSLIKIPSLTLTLTLTLTHAQCRLQGGKLMSADGKRWGVADCYWCSDMEAGETLLWGLK